MIGSLVFGIYSCDFLFIIIFNLIKKKKKLGNYKMTPNERSYYHLLKLSESLTTLNFFIQAIDNSLQRLVYNIIFLNNLK